MIATSARILEKASTVIGPTSTPNRGYITPPAKITSTLFADATGSPPAKSSSRSAALFLQGAALRDKPSSPHPDHALGFEPMSPAHALPIILFPELMRVACRESKFIDFGVRTRAPPCVRRKLPPASSVVKSGEPWK